MSSLQAQLKLSLLDNVTGPAKQVQSALMRLKAAAKANAADLDAMRGKLFDAVAASYALSKAIKEPIETASKFEGTMLQLGLKAELGSDAIKELGIRIRALAPIINQTAQEAAEGMDVLTGMGMDVGAAEKVLPTLGKVATAYKAELTDLAKTGMAVMDNLKVKIDEIPRALDMMAVAGKKGAFELKDMARYMPELASMAQARGMSGLDAVKQLATAAEITRKGAGDAESAAGNLKNVLQKLSSDDTVKKFQKKAGVDLKKSLAAAEKKGLSPLQAIVEITKKTLEKNKGKVTIQDLFGDLQVQLGMAALVQNLDEWKKMLAEVDAANGVWAADFERVMKTNESLTKAFQVRLKELSMTIGNALLPIVNDTMASLTPVIKAMAEYADTHPKLVGGLIKAASGLIMFRIATIGARYAFLFMRGAVLSLLTPLVAVAGAMRALVAAMVMGGIARAVGAFKALRTAMLGVVAVGAIGGAGMAFKALGASMLALIAPTRLLAAAFVVLRGALILSGIGLALVAIGAAAKFISDNWDGLGKFVDAFSASLQKAAGTNSELKPFLGTITAIANIFKSDSLKVDDAQWTAWGESAGSAAAGGLSDLLKVIKAIGDGLARIKGMWGFITNEAPRAAGAALGIKKGWANPYLPKFLQTEPDPPASPYGGLNRSSAPRPTPSEAVGGGKRSDAGSKSFTVGDIHVTVQGSGLTGDAAGKAIGAKIKAALQSSFSDAALA